MDDLEAYKLAMDFIGKGDDGKRIHIEINTTAKTQGHSVWERPWMVGELLFEVEGGADAMSKLLQAKEAGALPLTDPLPLRHKPYSRICNCCKESRFFFDGINLVAENPCPYPDGFPNIEITLEVPSGRLLYSDWIPGFGPGRRESEFDVNHNFGIKETVEACEADKMAHFFVGNSCPGIYKGADGTYHVASMEYDEDTDKVKAPKDWEDVGSVCTDLWWCSFVDADEFAQRGGDIGRWSEVIEVEPGTYKFNYMLLKKPFENNYSEEVRYATFARVS